MPDEKQMKARKIRAKKEALILQTEDIDQARTELHEEGGSTSLAPLPKDYQKRLRKGAIGEVLISLEGEIEKDKFDEELSCQVDAARFLKESEK